MAVLIGWRLQEADCGKVACRDRCEEVVDIVLVVCRPIVADFSDISRSMWLGFLLGRVIIKERVMRNVVASGPCQTRRVSFATGSSVWVCDREIESTHEATPGDPGCAKQSTNVRSAHLHLIPGRVRADVSGSIRIANHSGRRPSGPPLTSLPNPFKMFIAPLVCPMSSSVVRGSDGRKSCYTSCRSWQKTVVIP